MSKPEETKVVRLYPSDIDKLYKIASLRFYNKESTKEKKFPTPAKIVNLLLRNQKIIEVVNKELYNLPAREDLMIYEKE